VIGPSQSPNLSDISHVWREDQRLASPFSSRHQLSLLPLFYSPSPRKIFSLPSNLLSLSHHSNNHPLTSSALHLHPPTRWPALQQVSSLYLELPSSRPRLPIPSIHQLHLAQRPTRYRSSRKPLGFGRYSHLLLLAVALSRCEGKMVSAVVSDQSRLSSHVMSPSAIQTLHELATDNFLFR
jgi:hypothetical protein